MTKQIVLAGNPNIGKSVFFNFLTGIYTDVSNYPGTTLEIYKGKMGEDTVVDTPGVYGLSSFNDEERIARDIILNADIVINIVNALHLERDLFLTQQIIDTGAPVIVALNMVDEAKKQGIEIEHEALSQYLGVPVIPTIAVKKKGLKELKENIFKAQKGNITPGLEEKFKDILDTIPSQGEALLVLEGDEVVSERYGVKPGEFREEIYLSRRERINLIAEKVTKETQKNTSFSVKLSRLMLKPATGVPIMALMLFLMYKFIGVFIAQTVVDFTEGKLMAEIYEPAVKAFIGSFIQIDSILGQFLAGEFGVFTMAVTYLIGLLLPLVVGFYFMISILEDSGYLPRIAALTDRMLNFLGLNGRAIIPIILGFGCVTMATIVTRLLGSDRERIITIFLLGLTIPCSAQLGVIAGLLTGLGLPYVILYIVVVLCVFVTAGTVLNRYLPGKSTDLLIDLPLMRIPNMLNVFKKTYIKSVSFLKEAAPLFVLGSVLITGFKVSGVLTFLQNVLSPLTVGWLRLPKEAANAFIMGIVRRDFGAAGLTSLDLTSMETVVALITMTLFVPCIASIMVLFKERSKKEAALIWTGSIVIAFIVGGIVSNLGRIFPAQNWLAVISVAVLFMLLNLCLILITGKRRTFFKKTEVL